MANFTTLAEMERLFSSYGVTGFADHNEDEINDTSVVDDCIEQATEEIKLYLLQRYEESAIVNVTLVRRWTTTLAVYFLCMRRGNDPAPSISNEFQRVLELLEKVLAGTMQLPGVEQLADLRPSVSNLTVDRRYTSRNIRVKIPSSNVPVSALPRFHSHIHGHAGE